MLEMDVLQSRQPQLPWAVDAWLQPIVSVEKQKIVGYEALARGADNMGQPVSPAQMFAQAQADGFLLELDQHCRAQAMSRFARAFPGGDGLYLFVNIDTSVVCEVLDCGNLHRMAHGAGLPVSQIVLELNERDTIDSDYLLRFVQRHKRQGFLVALDDVGTGYSNFERMAVLQPDIVKIDRSLLCGIEDSHHKQEIFRTLVHMASRIGAVTVAEGVETVEQAHCAMEYGVHLLQGFLFAPPAEAAKLDIVGTESRISAQAVAFLRHIGGKIREDRLRRQHADYIMDALVDRLCLGGDDHGMDDALRTFGCQDCCAGVECLYVLDGRGIQVSDTVFTRPVVNLRKGLLFYPAAKGFDHSAKRYFFEMANAGAERHVSEPYLSNATGNVCETVARAFALDGVRRIVCVDIRR